jgi:VacB/RNase II family 3'-5' exoribonuclease
MPNHDDVVDLGHLAHRAMVEHGLQPEFPPDVTAEVARLAPADMDGVVDLRHLPWCSIDNDDSRDLDQLTVGERLDGGHTRVLVAVADVDVLVPRGSAADRRAAHNTTSVYTAARVFPMLPERVSTDLTSLNPGVDRLAMVVEMDVDPEGRVTASRHFRAAVHNHAKLAYNAVDAWLDGTGPAPAAVADNAVLAEQVRLQDAAAKRLRGRREEQGALELDTGETRPVLRDGKVVDLRRDEKNDAKELIEDFMIAANGATARYLAGKGFATIRRVVRDPERWERIVELAGRHGGVLPATPDAGALEAFLHQRRRADPIRFPDLSLSVVKLIGKGEYVLERPGESLGHFGLAVRDYTHSTAPNRRYPDLITQRLLKAAFAGGPSPYDDGELADLAGHCTAQEDAANKVERRIRKSAAALLMRERVGESFAGVVTGASPKGTWVRTFHPPVEGKVVRGFQGMDVGDLVRVRLLGCDVERGFIDFAGRRESARRALPA